MNELYQVEQFSTVPGGATATVQLNPDHPIFKGHFPGQPVLPGVCMMELVREVAEKKLNMPLRITAAPLIKFLRMVDPRQTEKVQVDMTLENKEARIFAEGKLLWETTVFVKFRMEFASRPLSSVVSHGIF